MGYTTKLWGLFAIVGCVTGDGFVIPTTISGSCVAIETSHPISKILSASPSSITMSFALSPEKDYNEEFGHGSHEKQGHQEHYACALEIAKQINQITDDFLEEVTEYIDFRKAHTWPE